MGKRVLTGSAGMTGLLVVVAIGVLAPGSGPARAQGPEATKPAADLDTARQLVRRLEAQSDAQRFQLEVTEANLKLARAMLKGLESKVPPDPDLDTLQVREERLAKRLRELERIVRNSNDPSVAHTRELARRLRERIKEMESR